MGHRHGFGCSRCFVEKRCIGDIEARELGDHRLEVEEGLEAALRDLGLVRGVCGVPGGVLENVALDDRRRDGAVVTHADRAAADLVLCGEFPQFPQGGLFGEAHADREALGECNHGGNSLACEVVEVDGADGGEHRREITRVGTHVAGFELLFTEVGRGQSHGFS